MMLSLAIALLLATTLGVDAAPRASKKKAETSKIAQMVTVSGECSKLVHAGLAMDGCKPILVNMNYSTGASAYWFMTEGTILSFSGETAIGFCRFGNPTIKGSTLECVAHTQAGRYEGVFVTDGSPPKLEAFQVNQ